MKSIGNIYLSWRKGQGSRRHIVGVIRKNTSEGVRFSYIQKSIIEARQDGFSPYTEFPDINKVYTECVLEIFGQRLMKTERGDIKTFYDFWEIDETYKNDKYYLLAHTQGMVPTDNFEFLADFKPRIGLSFVTDLANVRDQNLAPGFLAVGDVLCYELEPCNEFDKYAVRVNKDHTYIGYIKKIHSRVFHSRRGKDLKLRIKAIDSNGKINRVFVKVSF